MHPDVDFAKKKAPNAANIDQIAREIENKIMLEQAGLHFLRLSACFTHRLYSGI